MPDSVRLYGQQPTKPLCPRDSLGKNTGVGCHFLLQGLGWSPINLYSKEFQGDANVADPGAHLEWRPIGMERVIYVRCEERDASLKWGRRKGQRSQETRHCFPCPVGRNVWECSPFQLSSGPPGWRPWVQGESLSPDLPRRTAVGFGSRCARHAGPLCVPGSRRQSEPQWLVWRMPCRSVLETKIRL